jgi:hypothetical protein
MSDGERVAELEEEAKRLEAMDTIHWKTRRSLLAEIKELRDALTEIVESWDWNWEWVESHPNARASAMRDVKDSIEKARGVLGCVID